MACTWRQPALGALEGLSRAGNVADVGSVACPRVLRHKLQFWMSPFWKKINREGGDSAVKIAKTKKIQSGAIQTDLQETANIVNASIHTRIRKIRRQD